MRWEPLKGSTVQRSLAFELQRHTMADAPSANEAPVMSRHFPVLDTTSAEYAVRTTSARASEPDKLTHASDASDHRYMFIIVTLETSSSSKRGEARRLCLNHGVRNRGEQSRSRIFSTRHSRVTRSQPAHRS
jgi:hypothetical protein